MADKKPSPKKKTSSEKSSSKAAVNPSASEIGEADPTKDYVGREMIPAAMMEFMSVQQSFHSGPLPSPENFAKYNKGVPDAAERILSMAERNQRERERHQREMSALRFLVTKLVFIAVISYMIVLVVVALYAPSLYVFPAGVTGLGVIVGLALYHFKGGNKD